MTNQIRCTVVHESTQLQALSKIFDAVFESEVDTPRTTDLKIDSHVCAIAALHNEAVVGGLVAYELLLLNGTKEMYLYDIAVLPDHQQQGIGTALIAELKAEAMRRGVTTIFVEAEAEDAGAVAFYRSLAGEEIEVRHFNISVS